MKSTVSLLTIVAMLVIVLEAVAQTSPNAGLSYVADATLSESMSINFNHEIAQTMQLERVIEAATSKASLGGLSPEATQEAFHVVSDIIDHIDQRLKTLKGSTLGAMSRGQEDLLIHMEKVRGIAETATLILQTSLIAANADMSEEGTAVSEDDTLLSKSSLAPMCRPNENKLLDKVYITVCYNLQWKIPMWVGYHLELSQISGDVKRTDRFRFDPSLGEDQQASLSDYLRSGFDRGHMAPSADFRGDLVANAETFLMTNIAPQTPALNRVVWRKIESDIRKLVDHEADVWVYTGNLVPSDPENAVRTLDGGVHVPSHSWKAILVANGDTQEIKGLYGLLVPNWFGGLMKNTSHYVVSVDKLEEQTGLDFFSQLPDDIEGAMEAVVPKWPPVFENFSVQ